MGGVEPDPASALRLTDGVLQRAFKIDIARLEMRRIGIGDIRCEQLLTVSLELECRLMKAHLVV